MYGKAREQGLFEGGVTPREMERYAEMFAKKSGVEATHRELEPGVDTGYEEPQKNRLPQGAVVKESPPPEVVTRTLEEERIERWLKGRQEVEVEM